MEHNFFHTDTKRTGKKLFLDQINGIFICSIFLTGLCSVAGIVFLVRGVLEKAWLEMGVAGFVWKIILYLTVFCIFCSFIKMALDEKPFSKTLTLCIRIIAVLFLMASIVMPRLQGYESSGFELFKAGAFVLIDGGILLTGLLLFILGSLVQAGFEMQKEMDEIL